MKSSGSQGSSTSNGSTSSKSTKVTVKVKASQYSKGRGSGKPIYRTKAKIYPHLNTGKRK